MSKFLFFKKLFLIFFASLILFSCKKNNSVDPLQNLPQESETNNNVDTQIFGVVTDENNKPIPSVQISINNRNVSTDINGFFSNKNIITTQRTVLKASYAGYFQSIHLLQLDGKKTENVHIKLQRKTVVANFNASNGITANIGNGGASVIFPANGYVNASNNQPYIGMVNVYARFANIDSPDFLQTVPASMRATDANGVVSNLQTFGMMEVIMEDASGNLLQLSTNKATIKMPIANSQTATSPNTIPLWYLDETTAMWKQEGQATKKGNVYEGEVSHFTWWNCDIAQAISQRASIKGRTVISNNGIITPMSGVYLYSTLGGGGYTDGNGQFGYDVVASVTSGTPLVIYFRLDTYFCVTNSIIINVPALSVGQVYDMGDINVSTLISNPTIISGNVNQCNNTPVGEYGFIRAYDSNDNFLYSTTTNSNSQFNLRFCQVPAKILFSTFSGEYKILTNVTAGNLGTVTLNCANPENDNEYTLNGDGFNNFQFRNTGINLPYVFSTFAVREIRDSLNDFVYTHYFLSPSNLTWGQDYTVNEPGYGMYPILIGLYVNTSSSGTQKRYQPVSGQTVITSNTATEIKGTFSGIIKNTQTNALVSVSNGKFRARKQ